MSNDKQIETSAMRRAAPSSTNLPLVKEETATEEVRAMFAQYRERFSRTDLPGILLCFAGNAAVLQGMLVIAEGFLFGESLLCRRHKEMIGTYISQQNACPYCADSHAVLLAAQGGTPEMICALQLRDLDGQQFTNSEKALLQFAGKVNADSSAVTPDDVEAARQAGWTETQIAEAVHIAAFFAAFNRIANAFGLPSPYPKELRGRR